MFRSWKSVEEPAKDSKKEDSPQAQNREAGILEPNEQSVSRREGSGVSSVIEGSRKIIIMDRLEDLQVVDIGDLARAVLVEWWR